MTDLGSKSYTPSSTSSNYWYYLSSNSSSKVETSAVYWRRDWNDNLTSSPAAGEVLFNFSKRCWNREGRKGALSSSFLLTLGRHQWSEERTSDIFFTFILTSWNITSYRRKSNPNFVTQILVLEVKMHNSNSSLSITWESYRVPVFLAFHVAQRLF